MQVPMDAEGVRYLFDTVRHPSMRVVVPMLMPYSLANLPSLANVLMIFVASSHVWISLIKSD